MVIKERKGASLSFIQFTHLIVAVAWAPVAVKQGQDSRQSRGNTFFSVAAREAEKHPNEDEERERVRSQSGRQERWSRGSERGVRIAGFF